MLYATVCGFGILTPRLKRNGAVAILAKLSDVSFGYGQHMVLESAAMMLDRGEVVGLLGLNGSGKTTTMRLIAGILDPVSGTVQRHYRRLGYLPEERGLYRRLTVTRYLRFVGEVNLLAPERVKDRIGELIERLRLEAYQSQRIESLSKGNQQKVQLAATLMPSPELMLWDEPFSGLDALNQELLLDMLRDLRQSGVTVLLSTHRLDDLELLADRTYILARRGFSEYVTPDRPESYRLRLVANGTEQQWDVRPGDLADAIRQRTSEGAAVLAVEPKTGLEDVFRRLVAEG